MVRMHALCKRIRGIYKTNLFLFALRFGWEPVAAESLPFEGDIGVVGSSGIIADEGPGAGPSSLSTGCVCASISLRAGEYHLEPIVLL